MTTNEPDFLNYLKTGDMTVTGQYDIPVMKGLLFKEKALKNIQFMGFNYATNPLVDFKEDKIVHFFLGDYRFQQVWNSPQKYLNVFRKYKAICSPDFSMYTNMPKAMQIFQHYRRMWMSAYYQREGIRVIPAPCWSTKESFEYCFDGMPQHSAIVISSVGCVQNPSTRKLFLAGFEKTCEVLDPAQVLLYGVVTKEMKEIFPNLVHVEDDMSKRKRLYMMKQEMRSNSLEVWDEL